MGSLRSNSHQGSQSSLESIKESVGDEESLEEKKEPQKKHSSRVKGDYSARGSVNQIKFESREQVYPQLLQRMVM
jgi:hypothetical protein